MIKRYGLWSALLIILGILIAFEPYAHLNIILFNSWGKFFLVIFIGIGIYLIGVILGIIAFKRREKGFLKYISVISVVAGVFFIGFIM